MDEVKYVDSEEELIQAFVDYLNEKKIKGNQLAYEMRMTKKELYDIVVGKKKPTMKFLEGVYEMSKITLRPDDVIPQSVIHSLKAYGNTVISELTFRKIGEKNLLERLIAQGIDCEIEVKQDFQTSASKKRGRKKNQHTIILKVKR